MSKKPVAIILAAGEGRRISFPKALLEARAGETFLGALALTFQAAGCQVLAVAGKHAAQIRARHPELALVENPDWKQGQLSSARRGLSAALQAGAEQLLIHPVDAPCLRSETVKRVLGGLSQAEAALPKLGSARGHPLALTRQAAEKLLAQNGAPHLEAALQALEVAQVTVEDPGVLCNINTPADYERAFGRPPRIIS